MHRLQRPCGGRPIPACPHAGPANQNVIAIFGMLLPNVRSQGRFIEVGSLVPKAALFLCRAEHIVRQTHPRRSQRGILVALLPSRLALIAHCAAN